MPSPHDLHDDPSPEEDFADIRTLDDVAARLRTWRAADGSPSFTEIARRIAQDRRARNVHPRHGSPGRMTVYDAFADGRKRLDVHLVVDIARALGISGALLERWRGVCVLAQNGGALTQSVTARLGLPPRTEVFVSRLQERATCLAATAPVVIEGMAGVGKTALALQVAAELVERDTVDDVVVVPLGDTRSPDDVASSRGICEAIMRALDEPVPAGAGTGELADTVVDLLAARRLALVLDDVTTAEQVAEITSAGPTTPLLVTTRTQLAVSGVSRLPLSTWHDDDTIDLLSTVLGSDVRAEDPVSAGLLAQLIDGLPLTAALTAARVRGLPDWTLADHASALQGRLSAHRLDEPVSAAMALTYSTLSAPAQRCLRLLAAQPCHSLSSRTLGALIGDADTHHELIDELTRANAVLRRQADRVSLHSLVRSYAVSRSWEEDAPSARHAAIDRMTESLLEQAWGSSERLYPGALQGYQREREVDVPESPEVAARWFADELDSLMELAMARAAEAPHVTVEIAQALSRNFDNRGRWPLAISLHRAAVEAARRAGDRAGEAYAELGIGTTSVRLGLPEAATHLERARRLSEEIGLRRPGYSATNALAILAAQGGEPRRALELFRESLRLAREDGAHALAFLVIDNIAVILRRLGDLEGALQTHLESYDEAMALDNRDGAATSLGNVSEVFLLLGRIDEAIDAAERAREIAESVGSTMTYAYATANLGLGLYARGERARGIELNDDALEIARDNSLRALEVSCMNNLGHMLVDDDPDTAERWLTRAAELGAELEMTDERSRTLHGFGRVALARGHKDLARTHLTGALDLLDSDEVPEAAAIRTLLDDSAVSA